MKPVDRISVLSIGGAILLLAGMALELPADPTVATSICRSRTDGVDAASVSATTLPKPALRETASPAP